MPPESSLPSQLLQAGLPVLLVASMAASEGLAPIPGAEAATPQPAATRLQAPAYGGPPPQQPESPAPAASASPSAAPGGRPSPKPSRKPKR